MITVYGIMRGQKVLYVGQTANLKLRAYAHFAINGKLRGKPKSRYHFVTFAKTPPKFAILVEVALIQYFQKTNQCKYNKVNSSGALTFVGPEQTRPSDLRRKANNQFVPAN